MTQTINRTQLRNAAIAACRAAWKDTYGGNWDTDCPDKPRWIREEKNVLIPALETLGIDAPPEPIHVKGHTDIAEALRRSRSWQRFLYTD